MEMEDVDEHDDDEEENEDEGGVREMLDRPFAPWWLLFSILDLLTLLLLVLFCGGQFWFENLFPRNIPEEFSSAFASSLL